MAPLLIRRANYLDSKLFPDGRRALLTFLSFRGARLLVRGDCDVIVLYPFAATGIDISPPLLNAELASSTDLLPTNPLSGSIY